MNNTTAEGVRVDEQTGLTGWILAGVATVVSTLAGIVAYFYKQQITDYRSNETMLKAKVVDLESRADKCENDREELRIRHAVLENKHANLELRVADLEVNKKNRDSIG